MFKRRKEDETRVEELPPISGAQNFKTVDGGYLGPGVTDDVVGQRKNQYDIRRQSTLSNMNASKAWMSDASSNTGTMTTGSTAGTTVKKNKCCNPDYAICGGCCYPYTCCGFSSNQSLVLMAVGILAALTCLIIGGVLLITTMMASWRMCYTPECVVAAGEMITAMDHTVDPCENFYQFACGGWERQNPVPAGSMGWDAFSKNAATTYFSIKELLEVESTADDPEFVNQTRIFYKACANDSAWEMAGVLPLLGEMSHTGGFPLINQSWSAESFNWLDSVVLMKVLYAADYLISIGVSYDSKNSSINVIHIGEGYLPSPREYILSNDSRYYAMEIQRIISIGETLGASMPSNTPDTAALNQSTASVALNKTESNTTEFFTTTNAPDTAAPEQANTTKRHGEAQRARSQQEIKADDEALILLLESSKHKKKMQMEGSGPVVILDGIAPALSSVKLPPVAREDEPEKISAPRTKANQQEGANNITELYVFIYKLAKLTRSAAESNDLHIQYNPMTIAQLQKKTDDLGSSAAAINWLEFVNSVFKVVNITVTMDERIIVTNPDYIYGLLKLIQVTPDYVIANYLSYMLALNLGEETSEGFKSVVSSAFPVAERGARYIGRKEIRPWYDCASKTDSLITEAVSYLYLKKYFLPATRQKAAEMMEDVHNAFRSMLQENSWMDEETMTAGLKKVDEMVQLVAYGSNTTNVTALSDTYADLPQFTDDHFQNILRIAKYLSQKSLAYYREIPSRENFGMSPVSINAAYSFGQNAMIIPAGILQPPFYRRNTLTALNYGAIGIVIGHEVSHGFDSSGKEVDDQGNLRSWWTNASKETYESKARCFAEQYSQYPQKEDLFGDKTTLLGYKIDGNVTLGENIADNGGIQAAYRAYKKRMDLMNEDFRLPGMEAYSNEQLFFISFAQMWCTSFTLQGLKGAILVGPHAPGPFRVKGTFHNTDQLRNAFQCPRPAQNNTCRVW
ncbi:Peptidase M13 C-terminal domain [Trinorchestia longiramus]|nr:Peptidase M13 C-terminal domain [Trinorchestia longiramus]